jgi:hypothetical protein
MVVVGGQSLCLLLTLLIVPAATMALDDLQRIPGWFVRKFKERP